MRAVRSDRQFCIDYCRTTLREARARRLSGSRWFALVLLEWAANGRRRIPPRAVVQPDLFGGAAA